MAPAIAMAKNMEKTSTVPVADTGINAVNTNPLTAGNIFFSQ
jgi:hypothetical protein